MIEAILDDLERLLDSAMWAHTHGYSKAGRGLDAEHGADLSRTEAERAEGPTYDLDLGDHRCRVAYQHAVRAVSRSDRRVAAMLLADGYAMQLPVEMLNDYVFPYYLRRTIHRLRWRLRRVNEETHKERLRSVEVMIRRAADGLADALEDGTKLYTAHKDNPCPTCGVRDKAAKKSECNTCSSYRFLHGHARDPKKDRDSISQARAAQARRRARGEGWGAA